MDHRGQEEDWETLTILWVRLWQRQRWRRKEGSYRAVFARLGDEAHVTRERSRRIQDAFQSWETVCHLSKWEGPGWGGDRNGKFCFTYVDFEMPGRCPNGDDN